MSLLQGVAVTVLTLEAYNKKKWKDCLPTPIPSPYNKHISWRANKIIFWGKLPKLMLIAFFCPPKILWCHWVQLGDTCGQACEGISWRFDWSREHLPRMIQSARPHGCQEPSLDPLQELQTPGPSLHPLNILLYTLIVSKGVLLI